MGGKSGRYRPVVRTTGGVRALVKYLMTKVPAMKQQHAPGDGKPAITTTPVEIEPTDEFQPAYGRGGPIRSDEPERDWFFEDSAAGGKHVVHSSDAQEAQSAANPRNSGTRPEDCT